MKKELSHLLTHSKRQHLRVLAFVLFLVSLTLFTWWGYQTRTFSLHNDIENTSAPENISYSTLSAPPEEPALLEVPSVNIATTFETPLDLDENRIIEVPKGNNTVAWYKNGSLPGEIGPSVIIGHVDSKDGPAVFYSLGQVSVDDEVLITRTDGSVLTYTISHYERVEQDTFPTLEVYGDIPYAGLRLVTCSGTYDRKENTYSHNLIVYAALTNYTPPPDEL